MAQGGVDLPQQIPRIETMAREKIYWRLAGGFGKHQQWTDKFRERN